MWCSLCSFRPFPRFNLNHTGCNCFSFHCQLILCASSNCFQKTFQVHIVSILRASLQCETPSGCDQRMAKYNLHMLRAFLHYGRLCASLRFLSAWTIYHRIHKSGSWKWLFSSVEDYVLLKDSSWHELFSQDLQSRVLKMAFLLYGRLCGSLRLYLTWTFCHIIHKSGSWNWLFSSMENYVPL